MASYQYDAKKGTARIHFRYGGRQLNKVETVDSERHAQRIVALVEETIIDLERGKLVMPADADPKVFILTGGKVEKLPQLVADPLQEPAAMKTVKEVFDVYHTTLTVGSKESNTRDTEQVHARHFKRVFGEDRAFETLDIATIQTYVDVRSNKGVVRETIRKELTTLRVVWAWAFKRGHISKPADWKINDLTLPKSGEKPPFMTWEQITRKIERDRLKDGKADELWECLWLDEKQTLECLEWVREHARYPFIHPMFAFAAYTGARRSELLRSERDDWDFAAGVVSVRQKKADRSKVITRRSVPIHPELGRVMQRWFKDHPGGPWTLATSNREPIGPRMATKYFRQTLGTKVTEGDEDDSSAADEQTPASKWSVLRGFHVFRHSLASNMASNGVDQRVINEILGHHTEDMERRYRHLLPKKKEHALASLFAAKAAI